ncbi:MAG: anaerobic ribonucleoside-triphosphate reductase activating protein [Tenericutes bacterium]|nr:anaerobic ribonucleoside-triphosphate reductase activating protein [Mycoplasmatota bacterium]MDD7630279.1 anaerobic ribonucleoside-triphosphate reductase activating protein [bacterium]MDY4108340.1 anaerobic ribonucleoside-triphosphate reductase activating protein [Bacilli bacterium]
MKISGFDKLTLLNYPDKVACTIFTSGCNLRCPFCHNSGLVTNNYNEISFDSIYEYLKKRIGILDGVCITGGEPLIHADIKDYIKKIKDLGYLVKIDTNGCNPKLLKELIDLKLVDYIAMDIKNIYSKYDITSGVKVNIDNIKKSISIIENSGIDYEFRTTIVKEFHSTQDIKEILSYISSNSNYYIQNFKNSNDVFNRNLSSFSEKELVEMKNKINNKNIYFRDL